MKRNKVQKLKLRAEKGSTQIIDVKLLFPLSITNLNNKLYQISHSFWLYTSLSYHRKIRNGSS